MGWYYYIALVAVFLQMVFMVQMLRNHHYVLSKYNRKRGYRPRTALCVPCKGIDSAFDENISSLFRLDYENYLLWFVVEEESDPAYEELCLLKDRLAGESMALDVRILIAGKAEQSGQKVHNLLYCYKNLPEDVEVLAFADSDACVRKEWLSHLVYPLRKSKHGAASGYRWFVPKENNFATLALSCLNAKIAQLLGNTHFNQAWGGSMAIRVDVFERIELDVIWENALSDDLSLSYAVKNAGLKVAFVPRCLVASYEATSWRGLFEFGRRQFMITRISAFKTWLFGLFSASFSVLGLWGGGVLAIFAWKLNSQYAVLYTIVPIIFFTSQFMRAILRQHMISRLLEKDVPRLKKAMAADIIFFWLWSLILVVLIGSSAFGSTICWRGIRYKMVGPTETIILDSQQRD
jgi:cellulose synthase/poly-beta-1,6-N-acetylglucosamine synthase-like glycosyltransferase